MSRVTVRHCLRRLAALSIICVFPMALASCGEDSSDGGSSSTEASTLDVTITEDGDGAAVFEVSSDIQGGLTELTVTNEGKAPHLSQLFLADEGHSSDELLKVFGSDAPPPEWIHGEGGVGRLAPGESGTSTVNLDPGSYILTDLPNGPTKAPPGHVELTVAGGEEGDLPETDATVTAAELKPSEDSEGGQEESGKPSEEYDWEISGLVAGENLVTFNSEGEKALHHIVAVPIVADATFEDVQKEFASQPQGEPKTVDFSKSQETAVLDGEKSSVVELNLEEGRYAFICFFSDKGDKTSHFEEGLFDEVQVPSE